MFRVLDEEVFLPKGSDAAFLSKIQTSHAKHSNFVRTPASKLNVKNALKCFGVVHYAGTVYYDTTGFLEKNKDTMHEDVKEMIRGSTVPLVSNLLSSSDGAVASGDGGGSRSKKTQTLSAQFRSSLTSLMEELNRTSPSFVRTIKSNTLKQSGLYDARLVLGQLRCSGLLEGERSQLQQQKQ